MKENNQNFNPEDWYNQLYQAVYKSGGKKAAEMEVRVAREQHQASPHYPVEDYIDMITM